MSDYRIAPASLFRGTGAVEEAAGAVAALGKRVLLVAGKRGEDVLAPRLATALGNARLNVYRIGHSGPCCEGAIERVEAAIQAGGAEVVLGVGGGRVLDTAKAAADACRRPFASIPTSPATCAAVTPVSVIYDSSGSYLRNWFVARAPEIAVLDGELLAAAPDRLLVAGILDALAKIHEVRHTTGSSARHSPTARAALTLCDDLEALLAEHAPAAVAPLQGDTEANRKRHRVRMLVAEACVLSPGLIGGLAGEAAKLAAAHPLHNALTMLPGSHSSLHGEIVGFGVLVQMSLAGAGEAAVRREAGRFAQLGLACHLVPLGCAAALAESAEDIALRTISDSHMRLAFPQVDAPVLLETIDRVDGWAREEAEAVFAARGVDH